MFITIAVIAYNEENTIKNILDDISRQDYDHSLMEVVLVDSASTDGTKAVMQKFADENKMGARQIIVLDNPKKTLPCGWNVLLDNYTGEAVIRVDAHAHIPEDFVSKNVKVLEEGEMVVGGVRPNIVDEETPWKDTLLLAESSMFGSSIAPYRNGGNGTEEKIYMESLFHAAYRREVFEKIGHFANEFSTLITWSLESSMETSMSMESRGYGLKGRTSFNRFRFTLKDTFTIIIMLVCFVMAVIPIAGKKLAVYYLPVIYYTKSGVEGVLAVTAFVILTVIPLIIEITGDVQYKRRSSYNER